MIASMSRSITMLKVFAPPAASVPPSERRHHQTSSRGMPFAATTIVGMVVTSRSSFIRGLVSARYTRNTSPNGMARRGP